MPLLSRETGAYEGSSTYSKTLRGILHKEFFDQIWPNISKQLDQVEHDINHCIEVEVDKAIDIEMQKFADMDLLNDSIITDLRNKIEILEEENRLFRENKAGMVHGKQYGI